MFEIDVFTVIVPYRKPRQIPVLRRHNDFSDSVLNDMDTDLQKTLNAPASHFTAWAAGFIPQYCYNEAVSFGLRPTDVEIRNVFYADCGAPWAKLPTSVRRRRRSRGSGVQWKDKGRLAAR